MRLHARTAAPCALVGLALGLLTACSLIQTNSSRRNHAFIKYWPPPKGSTELRLAVKDNIDMKGHVTSAGSEYISRTRAPAVEDAECLAIARERNVRIVGKTNLTEFAVTVSGENRYFGNPRNRPDGKNQVISGGSSSGSAVAVASGMADIAFGTDTAGSIRFPSACCGIYGLKTTHGLVSIKGVFPISPKHLDTVGPMARDISGLVQGMDLLQRGFAAKYAQAVAEKPVASQIKVGRLYLRGTDPEIDEAVDAKLTSSGFKVTKLDDEFRSLWEQAQKDGKVVAAADAWVSDQSYAHEKGVSFITKAVLALGKMEHALNYEDALKRKAAWQKALKAVFAKVDFIALPTLKAQPPKFPFLGSTVVFEWMVFDIQNTIGVNFAGNPALAVPIPMPARERRDRVASLRKPVSSIASLTSEVVAVPTETGATIEKSSLRDPVANVIKLTHGSADKRSPITSLQLVGRRLGEAELLNAGRLIESKH